MSYNVYTVRLEPRVKPAGVRADQAALFGGYTYIRVRAESADYAAIKGVAMVPWAYVHAFAATAVREPAKA